MQAIVLQARVKQFTPGFVPASRTNRDGQARDHVLTHAPNMRSPESDDVSASDTDDNHNVRPSADEEQSEENAEGELLRFVYFFHIRPRLTSFSII